MRRLPKTARRIVDQRFSTAEWKRLRVILRPRSGKFTDRVIKALQEVLASARLALASPLRASSDAKARDAFMRVPSRAQALLQEITEAGSYVPLLLGAFLGASAREQAHQFKQWCNDLERIAQTTNRSLPLRAGRRRDWLLDGILRQTALLLRDGPPMDAEQRKAWRGITPTTTIGTSLLEQTLQVVVGRFRRMETVSSLRKAPAARTFRRSVDGADSVALDWPLESNRLSRRAVALLREHDQAPVAPEKRRD